MIYKAWHESGFLTLYKNNSKSKVLTEVIEYQLENMYIDGMRDEKIAHVKVGPGEEQLIKIKNSTMDGKDRKLTSKIYNKLVKDMSHRLVSEHSDGDLSASTIKRGMNQSKSTGDFNKR